MAKLHILGHQRRLDATLAVLHRLRVMHLLDVGADSSVRLPPLGVDDRRSNEVESLRYLRARLGGLLALVPDMVDSAEEPTDLERIRREVDEVAPRVEVFRRELDDLEAERAMLPRHLLTLRRLLPLVPDLAGLGTYDTDAVVLDARHAGVLAELNLGLSRLLEGNYEIISDQVDADTVGAVVVFPAGARTQVDALFGRQQVNRVRLPRQYESLPIRDAITGMERRLEALPTDIERVENQIAEIVGRHPQWPEATRVIGHRLDQLEAMRRVGATTHAFVISGWVPRARIRELLDALESEVGAEVLVEEVPTTPDDRPPVLLANPRPARPFETLVRLLALPRSRTIDPTGLMAVFLPLFFGMMLGDIVYGGVILLIATIVTPLLRRRSRVAGDLGRVLILAACWSVVWGVIYGEFLGNLGHRLFGLSPLWINREEALQPLLLFALAVGAVHVVLGLVLGVWQSARLHDRHTLVERAGNLVALIGLLLVAGVVAGRLPDGLMTPAVAAIVVGVVVLGVIAGPTGILLGPLELIGTVGNVLSYLRIAAIGLASVYLARVANELGSTGPLWLGVIIGTLFHALNLVLGAFSPTIQSLRLHYVEFFGRFYEEGGQPFEPFGACVDVTS